MTDFLLDLVMRLEYMLEDLHTWVWRNWESKLRAKKWHEREGK